MASPAEHPCVKRRRLTTSFEDEDKENVRCAKANRPLTNVLREARFANVGLGEVGKSAQDTNSPFADCEPGRKGLRRVLSSPPPEEELRTNESAASKPERKTPLLGTKHCTNPTEVTTTVNPFDTPLLTQPRPTAPKRPYRRPPRTTLPLPARTVWPAPPRLLIDYEDLWDGVSSIPERDRGDRSDANYDFLYDGVWKRCVGEKVLTVSRVRERLVWRRRNGEFVDLDCPERFDPLVSVCGVDEGLRG